LTAHDPDGLSPPDDTVGRRRTLLPYAACGSSCSGSDEKNRDAKEGFSMAWWTAASNDHPFGTMLKVTNVANGKSVEVRVNDRLSGGDRIIDLSYAAAQQIGIVRAGLAE